AAPTSGGGPGGFYNGVQPNPLTVGGGGIHLTVNGLLTVQGALSANGLSVTTNNAGGGAGGGLWLTVGGLAGNGAISADGGNGHLPNGGGGGGGRVAIYYGSNSFTGNLSAKAGIGFTSGGAGTIYSKRNADNFATITVDNANVRG